MRAAGIALVLAGCLCGCKPSGEEHYLHARARYQALVDQSVRPTDPLFDPVIQELAQVTPDAKDYATAQRMLKALRESRVPPPTAPLAVSGLKEVTDSPDVIAQRQACEALAKQLGAADAGARPRLSAALDDCQKKVHALEEAHEKQP